MVREENMRIGSYNNRNQLYEGSYNQQRNYNQNNYNQQRDYNQQSRNKAQSKESIERQILNLAKTTDGKLTVTQVAMNTSLSLEDAEKHLQNMVKSGYVHMDVSESGIIIYEFIELI